MAKDTTPTEPEVIVDETPVAEETPVVEETTTVATAPVYSGIQINRNY